MNWYESPLIMNLEWEWVIKRSGCVNLTAIGNSQVYSYLILVQAGRRPPHSTSHPHHPSLGLLPVSSCPLNFICPHWHCPLLSALFSASALPLGDPAAFGPPGCKQQKRCQRACWDSGGLIRGGCHCSLWVSR